jgi:hypothetical protein
LGGWLSIRFKKKPPAHHEKAAMNEAHAGAGAACIRESMGGSPPFHLSRNLFEVKIAQIHISARQDMHSENIPSLGKVNLKKL